MSATRLLIRLLQAEDPVLAVFADLQGDPQTRAGIIWDRLRFLVGEDIITCPWSAAGEVLAHPALDQDTARELLLVAGQAAVRVGEGVPA